VSMRTGRWSELSAEQEVRYTGIERFLFFTMSRISGLTEGLYGLLSPVHRSDGSSRRHNHVGVSHVSCVAASSNPRVWR